MSSSEKVMHGYAAAWKEEEVDPTLQFCVPISEHMREGGVVLGSVTGAPDTTGQESSSHNTSWPPIENRSVSVSDIEDFSDGSQIQDTLRSVFDHEKAPVQQNNHRVDGSFYHCKARGLGNTHNEKNAMIFIPKSAKHGTVLMCSHEECTRSGRRFRYCDVCKKPVAKRNFSVRHSHGLPMTVTHDKACWETVSQQDILRQVMGLPVAAPASRKQSPEESLDTRTSSRGNETAGDGDSSRVLKKKWMSLLKQRPNVDDSAAMSTWMSDVLSTATNASLPDMHTSSREQGQNSQTSSDSQTSSGQSTTSPPSSEQSTDSRSESPSSSDPDPCFPDETKSMTEDRRQRRSAGRAKGKSVRTSRQSKPPGSSVSSLASVQTNESPNQNSFLGDFELSLEQVEALFEMH